MGLTKDLFHFRFPFSNSTSVFSQQGQSTPFGVSSQYRDSKELRQADYAKNLFQIAGKIEAYVMGGES